MAEEQLYAINSLNEENGVTENILKTYPKKSPDTNSGDDTLGNLAIREEETSGTSYKSDEYPVSSDEETGDKQDAVSRDDLITSLSRKMVAYKSLDVFLLHPPPPSYRE
ncbi:Hypothetical predicted protein [Mytilus galloprovincialis]|uniref:Uncharacterized protein n=1 Tax=Mytilus galloprovincialis TaxID=29158 RepID=A0A8B6GD04_MYTGA|nr:Hypothetical predicted protein [Mytilus galloprovincialis]